MTVLVRELQSLSQVLIGSRLEAHESMLVRVVNDGMFYDLHLSVQSTGAASYLNNNEMEVRSELNLQELAPQSRHVPR